MQISSTVKGIGERISGEVDIIEDIEALVKENTKYQKLLNENIQEIQDTM